MANFTLWYQKRINAKDLSEAIRKAKNIKAEFHSLESNKDDERELTPLIGFQTDTESDFEDED